MGLAESNYITIPAGTGDYVITGLDHTPKAIIFMSTLQTATGITDTALFGYGFSDGTNHRSVSIGSDDNVATSVCGRRSTNTIAFIGSAGQTIVLEFTVKDLIPGGFTINITTNTVTGALVPYFSIGDDGITDVFVGSQVLSTGTASQDFTDPGFIPDLTLTASIRYTSHPGNATHAVLGLSFCKSATEQASLAIFSAGGGGTMDTFRVQRNNAGYVQINTTGGAVDAVASYSTIATGFNLNFSDLPATAQYVTFMCIKGIKCAIGDFAVTAGTGTQAVTAPAGNDWTPDGLILASDQSASVNPAVEAHNHLTFGMHDFTVGTYGLNCAIADEDATASSISETARSTKTDYLLRFLAINVAATASSTVVDLELFLDSIQYGGFTITKSVNTDAQLGRIIYVLFASILAAAEKQPIALGRPLPGQIAAFHSSRQRPIFG